MKNISLGKEGYFYIFGSGDCDYAMGDVSNQGAEYLFFLLSFPQNERNLDMFQKLKSKHLSLKVYIKWGKLS